MTVTELVARPITDVTIKKLQKLKEDQGFGEKNWAEWLTHIVKEVHLEDNQSESIQKHTRDGLLKLWCENLGHNLARIWVGDTLAHLVPARVNQLEKDGKDPDQPDGTAVVIGRGPSLFQKKHLEQLVASDYTGVVVCTDGALIEALKLGVRPDKYEKFISVTVDGHRELIRKWYDHELVDKWGPYISAVLCSSSASNVAERCEKAGVRVHWFHPLYDDYRNIESFTKIQQYITTSEKNPNGCPAMQAGGHAGATAWVLSWVVLRRSPVALIGINLGYNTDTPLESTYYWNGLMRQTGGNIPMMMGAYETVHNPDYNLDAIVDPVFKHYLQAFRELAKTAPKWVETWNCTEGGALSGDYIKCTTFKEFLDTFKR